MSKQPRGHTPRKDVRKTIRANSKAQGRANTISRQSWSSLAELKVVYSTKADLNTRVVKCEGTAALPAVLFQEKHNFQAHLFSDCGTIILVLFLLFMNGAVSQQP